MILVVFVDSCEPAVQPPKVCDPRGVTHWPRALKVFQMLAPPARNRVDQGQEWKGSAFALLLSWRGTQVRNVGRCWSQRVHICTYPRSWACFSGEETFIFLLKILIFLLLVCVYVSMHPRVCKCLSMHVEVGGQLWGARFLLLPWISGIGPKCPGLSTKRAHLLTHPSGLP